MALVFTDLTKESTSTTGTGTLTLTGAVAKYQSFANIGTGNTTYYRIESGNDSEVGLGTYNGTLSRDTVFMSITAGVAGTTKITVADGATVSCVYPAERAVYLSETGTLGIGGAAKATAEVAITEVGLANSGSLAGSALDIAQTWNTTGNPTAIKLNVTNTASGTTSKLMDLQVNGASKFSVDKLGNCNVGGSSNSGISYTSFKTVIYHEGVPRLALSTGQVSLDPADAFGWRNASSVAATQDLYLYRDAANTLAQRNGVNAQTFRIYNTYTSVSDYSRLTFTTNANNHQITSEAAGTGAVKPIIKSVYTSASDPTATDVPTGFSSIWKNSGTGLVKLWVNDGGTFKSVTLV